MALRHRLVGRVPALPREPPYLNSKVRDKWGLPTVTFDCGWKANELNMRKDMMTAAAEMLEAPA